MALLQSILAPFRRVAFLLFRAQVKVRVGGGMRVELAEREAPQPAAPHGRSAPRDQAELDAIRRELAQVLDVDPETRASLRHLAYVERALQHKGLRALTLVPLEVLQTALDQFEGLVTNWEPRGLAALRSKMAVTVRERQAVDPPGEPPAREQRISEPSA